MKNMRIFVSIIYLIGFWSISWSQVNVSFSDYSVTKGDTIVIPIMISDVSNYEIISYKIELLFQSKVLKPLQATNQGTLTEDWIPPGIYSGIPGRVDFGAYGGSQLTGSGILVNIVFEVIGDYGDTTSLIFDSVVFNDNNPTTIMDDGFISIKLKPINITVTTSVGSKAKVFVDGETKDAPFVTTWYPGTEHTLSVDSLQNCGNGIKYQFISWSDHGKQTHIVAPTNDITYVAIMSAEYYLDLKSSSGNPIGEGWYHEGDSVSISVESLISGQSGTQYHFVGWIGLGTGAYTGADNPAKFQIMGPITETATWQTQYYLQVQTIPAGLTEISGTSWYNKNAFAITGTAPQRINDGQQPRQFKGWKLDGSPVEGNPISVKMDTSHVVCADYSLDVSITVTTNKGLGTYVMIDGKRMEAPASVIWSVGSQHTIACPEIQGEKDGRRFKFSAWSDHGPSEHRVQPENNMVYTVELKTEYQVIVKTDPPEIGEIEGSGWYNLNQNIQIGPPTLIVDITGKSYSFLNWRIDALIIDSNSFLINVDTSKTIVAKYLQNLFLSGHIKIGDFGISNVKLLISGGVNDSTFTNELGEFVFEGLIPGVYEIMPKAQGLDFSPQERNFSMLLFSLKNQDFVASDICLPEIKVRSPNGGEILFSGNTDSIRWNASDNVRLNSTSLFYRTDSEENWIYIDTLDPSKSSYLWTIPALSSMNCKIKVKVIDICGNIAEDDSDANFTITNGTIVSEIKRWLSSTFEVLQNYPNPFNSSTELRYNLDKNCNVIVQVFNLYGQQIKTLVNANQVTGNYHIKWDATDNKGETVPSGIYYYRVRAGSHSQTRRMILMR